PSHQIQAGQRGLHQDDVRPLLDVEADLPHRLVRVGALHLVGLAVAELRRGAGRLPEGAVEGRGRLRRVRHDGNARQLAASSALRMPATRPSIMSLGATMSIPARACVTATLPSRYTDASLSTSPSWITPQCPWSVYSHRHTSPITSRSGTARFTARAAC